MTDRATVFQTVQIGVETTPGTAVAASKKLTSLKIEPSIKADAKLYRAMGSKFYNLQALGKEWAEAKVSGAATYTELIYVLSSIMSYSAPAQQGVTTAYKWTFGMNNSAADTTKTYTIEEGSSDLDGDYHLAHRLTYGFFNEFGITFSRDETPVNGNMMGRRITDDITMSTNEVQTVTITGTPTGGTFTLTYSGQTTAAIAYSATASAVESALEALSNIGVGGVKVTGGVLPGTAVIVEFTGPLGLTNVAQMTASSVGLTGGTTPTVTVTTTTPGVTPSTISLIPIIPTQVSVYYADTQAGLTGASALTRTLKADFKISDRFSPIWPLNASNNSFVATVETEPKIQLKVLMEANSEGMALLSNLRTGTKKFFRVEAIGSNIASTYYYTFTLDFSGVVSDVSEFSDEDGVYAIEWTMDACFDGVWGKALQVELTNELTTL